MVKMKDGRPPRSLSAWRALRARGELDTRFPEVAMLIDTLAGNVDPDHVETALADAITSLKVARGRSRENLATTASVEERLLYAAADIERLAQDCHALKKLAVAVKAELKIATADLAEAETRLHSAMLQRDPVDRYERVIVNKLRAAGVTEKVARTINADHVIRIKEALDGAQSAGAPKSRSARRTAEVALAWTADNPWASVLASVEHYRLDRRPITSGAVDIAALRQCGLPPPISIWPLSANPTWLAGSRPRPTPGPRRGHAGTCVKSGLPTTSSMTSARMAWPPCVSEPGPSFSA